MSFGRMGGGLSRQPSVNDYHGADPTGNSDSTAALQNAITAAAGSSLFIPAGNYRISSTLVVASDTMIVGQHFKTRIFTAAVAGFAFLVNTNLSVHGDTGSYGVTLDSGIIIDGIYFDYGSLSGGLTHAISFRLAQNCVVRDCWFNGGDDGTAFLASKNMTVRDCIATGNTNVAYDHWDGVENCLVENCVATMRTATATSDNAGIMFSAANTGVDIRVTKGCIARGNKIYNAGIGIFINQLDTLASKTARCIIEDNELYSCLGGIYVTGAGYGHQVLNNYVEGGGGAVSGGSLVRIAGEAGAGTPSDCRVHGTVATAFTAIGANTGMFDVSGPRHILGDLTLLNGSGISGGVVYAVKTASSGCVIEGAQNMDSTSIAAISFGLFVGNNSAVADTNCTIRCWDGFASYQRYQGGADNFSGGPTIMSTTAVPAGGTAGSGLKFSSATNFGVFFGSGAPTLSAAKGSLYMRSDGSSTSTRMYVNTDGSTTWTNVTTAA